MDEEVFEDNGEYEGFFSSFINEIISSPLNMIMMSVVIYLLYKIMKASKEVRIPPPIPQAPKMKKQDMTLEQLKKYNGTDEHGRLCIGVNGKVFDVTRGKKFYGSGGPYSAFAGHDATRCFATFSVEDVKEEYDDISDLNSTQMESVKEWEIQFYEKYDYIGRLLKPGEMPVDYTDDEESKEKDVSEKKED